MAHAEVRRAALGAGALLLCLGLGARAFVPVAPGTGAPRHGQLRASGLGERASAPAAFSGAALPTVGVLALVVAAAAGCRVACRAAEVKKKGVRVVEGREIPWNLFAPKSPYKATCISNETITTRTSMVNWQTCHVVIKHDKNYPYLEGQSAGVISPGPDKKGEVPAKVRLYSIASSACGDDETSSTVSLCVKRVLEVEGRSWCEYSNVEPGKDPEYPDAPKVYRGVCSNHICDLKAGDDVLLTGPTGAEMLLPHEEDANIIMLATGTGIAPFRSFLRNLFHDKGSAKKFKGLAWLFLGVPFRNSLLYDAEWAEMKKQFPDQFRFDYAISDEMKNKAGKKMYVQHRVMEFGDEIWPMLKDKKTHVYMCGLKGMESGLMEAFEANAKAESVEWPEFVKAMKKEGRYHVEVY